MGETGIAKVVQLNERDVEDFFSHLSKNSVLMKLLIGFALVIFVAQLIRVITEPETMNTAIKWICFVIFLFIMMVVANKYNAQKAYRGNKRLSQEYRYFFSSTGILIEGSNVNFHLAWNRVYKLTESKKNMFVWINKKNAQIIPKRYLGVVEINEIKNLYKTGINQ